MPGEQLAPPPEAPTYEKIDLKTIDVSQVEDTKELTVKISGEISSTHSFSHFTVQVDDYDIEITPLFQYDETKGTASGLSPIEITHTLKDLKEGAAYKIIVIGKAKTKKVIFTVS